MVDARHLDKSPDAFRTISEVADELELPQHVLRFWETKFTQIRPVKRAGGRRYYRPDDVELLRGIRHLLYSEGYTIKGVQKILKDQGVRHVQALGYEDVGIGLPPVAAPAPIPASGADGGGGLGGLLGGLIPRRRGRSSAAEEGYPAHPADEPPLPFPDFASFTPRTEDPVPTRASRPAPQRPPAARRADPGPRAAAPEDDEDLYRADDGFRADEALPEPPRSAVPRAEPSLAPPPRRATPPQQRPSRGPASRIPERSAAPELDDPLLPFFDDEDAVDEPISEPLDARIRRLKEAAPPPPPEPGPPEEYIPARARRRPPPPSAPMVPPVPPPRDFDARARGAADEFGTGDFGAGDFDPAEAFDADDMDDTPPPRADARLGPPGVPPRPRPTPPDAYPPDAYAPRGGYAPPEDYAPRRAEPPHGAHARQPASHQSPPGGWEPEEPYLRAPTPGRGPERGAAPPVGTARPAVRDPFFDPPPTTPAPPVAAAGRLGPLRGPLEEYDPNERDEAAPDARGARAPQRRDARHEDRRYDMPEPPPYAARGGEGWRHDPEDYMPPEPHRPGPPEQYLPPHLRSEPRLAGAPQPPAPVLSRDDISRLQAALFELTECRRLIAALDDPQGHGTD